MTHHIKSFVESKPFHQFIVAVIVLAGVAAGLETSAAIMAKHGATLLALAKLILGIFIAEALLKIATHGRKPWPASPMLGTCSRKARARNRCGHAGGRTAGSGTGVEGDTNAPGRFAAQMV